jgi:hypothetical protein
MSGNPTYQDLAPRCSDGRTLVASLQMRFQVVLQWPAQSLDDYDEKVAVEDLLIAKLTKQSEVDGHDCRSGETNIFVHTDDPRRAFEEIQTILSGHKLWPDVVIAYRQMDGTEYRVLWPQGTTTFNVR